MMRVSKMTVYRLVHSGELPAVRVGVVARGPRVTRHQQHGQVTATVPSAQPLRATTHSLDGRGDASCEVGCCGWRG